MSEGYILMTIGMAVVFAALSLLLGAIILLKRTLERPLAEEERKTEKEQAETPPKPGEPVLDTQLIAILTAAVTAALGTRARVHRVRFFEEEYTHDHAWVQHGRSELHTSHRLKQH